MKSDDLTAALRRLAVDEERRSRPSDADAIITTPTARHQPRRSEHRRRPPLWLAVASVAAVVAVVAALMRLEDDQTVDVVPATEVPPVTGVPQVTGPAPNGWVAFSVVEQPDGEDIYLVRPGEDARRLEVAGSDTADEGCPAWSPDGTRLLLGRRISSSEAELVIVPVSLDGAAGAPTVIALDGFHAPGSYLDRPCGSWAPDGRWVVLLRGPGEVWVVDTQTSAIRRLPDLRPIDLEWRPGTDELALAGDLAKAEVDAPASTPVTVYSVSTGELHQLGAVEAEHLTWSPDGSTLAYTDEAGGLGLVDADGTNERVLVSYLGRWNHGIGPVWSPTGDSIAYQRLCCGRSETHEVVLVSVVDGTETVIEPPDAWYPYNVTWSPDGTTLLYTAWQSPNASSNSRAHVITIRPDTPHDVTVLTPGLNDSFGAPLQVWGRQPG